MRRPPRPFPPKTGVRGASGPVHCSSRSDGASKMGRVQRAAPFVVALLAALSVSAFEDSLRSVNHLPNDARANGGSVAAMSDLSLTSGMGEMVVERAAPLVSERLRRMDRPRVEPEQKAVAE
jgi:hypothetical protein